MNIVLLKFFELFEMKQALRNLHQITKRRISNFNQPRPIPLADKEEQKEIDNLIKEAHSNPDIITPAFSENNPLEPFPDNINPVTKEQGGPKGVEPTRFGDWERNGRTFDF
jgi:hypothetical protein